MAERDEVLEALDSVWPTQGELFATFESLEDEDVYVQYIDGILHVCWPFEGDPEDVLEDAGVPLPESTFVLDEDPGYSLEIAVGDLLADEVADFLLDLFERVLAPGHEFSASVERGR